MHTSISVLVKPLLYSNRLYTARMIMEIIMPLSVTPCRIWYFDMTLARMSTMASLAISGGCMEMPATLMERMAPLSTSPYMLEYITSPKDRAQNPHASLR